METPLFGNYKLRQEEDRKQFFEFFEKHVEDVYPRSIYLDIGLVLSEEEKNKSRELQKNLAGHFNLQFYILHGEEKVGWFFGSQIDAETFKMTNTGIFEAHRNQGIYKAMLPVILNTLKEKGFQIVTSRHSATNNQILIPKLQAGFTISGFEISDLFGTMVHLTYYFNHTRRNIINFRVGALRPDKQMAKLLSLNTGDTKEK
jgi:predicted GNAT family acetyltransferase